MILTITFYTLMRQSLLWIDDNSVRKRVDLARGNWRYVISITIHDAYDLHCRFL